MADKIRILQLAPRFPFPEDDGGKIGIANIFKEFANLGADVTLFAFSDGDIPQDHLKVAEKYGRLIIYNHSTANTPLQILKSALFGHSIYIKKHFPEKLKDNHQNIFNGNQAGLNGNKTSSPNAIPYDIIHADHSCMAPLGLFLSRKYNIPLGLRLHNIEWMIWRRYAEALPAFHPKRWYVSRQSKLLQNAEKRFFADADICFAITDKDKKRALDLSPTANVVTASAGVNPEEWLPLPDIERNRHELVLATTYQWRHNIDAVKWFVARVLPIVRSKVPDATLTLIGKNSPEWLNDYRQAGVNAVGYVDRVQPYLNKASLYVAPLFVGSGIRIKILEAMAMELPVIATPVSAEGITAAESNGLFVRDNADGFARIIIDLLNNNDRIRENDGINKNNRVRKIGTEARKFVIENYSWRKNVEIILDKYRELVLD